MLPRFKHSLLQDKESALNSGDFSVGMPGSPNLLRRGLGTGFKLLLSALSPQPPTTYCGTRQVNKTGGGWGEAVSICVVLSLNPASKQKKNEMQVSDAEDGHLHLMNVNSVKSPLGQRFLAVMKTATIFPRWCQICWPTIIVWSSYIGTSPRVTGPRQEFSLDRLVHLISPVSASNREACVVVLAEAARWEKNGTKETQKR